MNLKNRFQIHFPHFRFISASGRTSACSAHICIESLLQLRKDKAIKSFRKLIGKINSQLQSETSYNIDELFIQELLNEIQEMAPTKMGFALNTALGALSFIPIPLVSISTTILDLGKELKEYTDFSRNWLSFILKAKKLEAAKA